MNGYPMNRMGGRMSSAKGNRGPAIVNIPCLYMYCIGYIDKFLAVFPFFTPVEPLAVKPKVSKRPSPTLSGVSLYMKEVSE